MPAICERLDGVPLAIELAAARTNALGVTALEAQLDDRFRLLTRGERTASARHQTLRATLDWSYSQLTEAERIVFRRLEIFVGGWTLNAARAVCADGERITGLDVLELLASLVEKSLVVANVSAEEPRYRLLETMRAYALERLLEAGERDTFAWRHLAHFRRFVEKSEDTLGTVPFQYWLPPLRLDLDNIRAALQWVLVDGELHGDGVALVAALGWTFGRLSFFTEGQRWCRHALQALSIDYRPRFEANLQSTMMVYHHYVHTTTDQEAFEAATVAGMRAVNLYRGLNDQRGLAYTLPWLGRLYAGIGRRGSGDELEDEGIAYARALDDKMRLSFGLSWKSYTLEPENIPARRAVLAEALKTAIAISDAALIGLAENLLGLLAAETGDSALARSHLERSTEHYEQAGSNMATTVGAYGAVAFCALEQGDVPAGRAAVCKGIELWQWCQPGDNALWSLLSMAARIAILEGQAVSGAKLCRRRAASLRTLAIVKNGHPREVDVRTSAGAPSFSANGPRTAWLDVRGRELDDRARHRRSAARLNQRDDTEKLGDGDRARKGLCSAQSDNTRDCRELSRSSPVGGRSSGTPPRTERRVSDATRKRRYSDASRSAGNVRSLVRARSEIARR